MKFNPRYYISSYNIMVFIIIAGVAYYVYALTLKEIIQPLINPEEEITIEEIKEETVDIEINYKIRPLHTREYFPQMKALISDANDTINVLMYMIKFSETKESPVKELLDKLIEAVRRGVSVRVILNKAKFGNIDLHKSNTRTVEYLTSGGVGAVIAGAKENIHSKLVLVDNIKGIVGTHNWTDAALRTTVELSFYFEADTEIPKLKNYITAYEEKIIKQLNADVRR
jgi:phosphatidylserine/phosphatidylglycerophosphate/cardiolipin synthase-like enzyme